VCSALFIYLQQLIDAVARQDVYKTILVLSHCDATDRRQVSERFSPTDWRTALHITAFLGSVVILQLLLWVSTLPLHITAFLGSVVILHLLLWVSTLPLHITAFLGSVVI